MIAQMNDANVFIKTTKCIRKKIQSCSHNLPEDRSLIRYVPIDCLKRKYQLNLTLDDGGNRLGQNDGQRHVNDARKRIFPLDTRARPGDGQTRGRVETVLSNGEGAVEKHRRLGLCLRANEVHSTRSHCESQYGH
jgi:hypothetical protein